MLYVFERMGALYGQKRLLHHPSVRVQGVDYSDLSLQGRREVYVDDMRRRAVEERTEYVEEVARIGCQLERIREALLELDPMRMALRGTITQVEARMRELQQRQAAFLNSLTEAVNTLLREADVYFLSR